MAPPAEAASCGGSPESPPPPPRDRPVVGEAEEVEGRWPGRAPGRAPRRRKLQQPRLCRMHRETVLSQSLRKYGRHATRIRLHGEDEDEIICVPDEERPTPEPGLHHRLPPVVEHLVEVDVRQERR